MPTNSSTPALVLAWPVSPNRKGTPLAPEDPGIVVGWELTAPARSGNVSTVTTICAGILRSLDVNLASQAIAIVRNRHDDQCACSHCTVKILGLWESNSIDSKLARFQGCASSGPWWEDYERESVTATEHRSSQLLLYRWVFDLSHYRHITPWNESGSAFSTELCAHLSSGQLVFQALAAHIDGDTTLEPAIAISEEHGKRKNLVDEAVRLGKGNDKGEERNLFRRMSHFAMERSLTILHWKRYSGQSKNIALSERLPFIKFLLLLNTENWNAAELCGNSRPREELAQSYTSIFNRTCSVFLDGILGVLTGLLLIWNCRYIALATESVWRLVYDFTLTNGVLWLETFPAGFKLNVPLTQNMGREITMLVQLHSTAASVVWSVVPKEFLVLLLGTVSILFGFTSLAASLFDLLSVATAHIAIIATCFRAMHRSQLYLLASLWRLFRGKKKNILRRRTDSMEYDSMQLLLGMILFTAVAFLFTTILVYYAFFAVHDLAVRLVSLVLWMIYVAARYNPSGKCILRARHPKWFTERVYVVEVRPLSSDGRAATYLKTVPRTFSSLIAEDISPLLAPFGPWSLRLLCELLRGAPSSLLEECLNIVSSTED